MKILVILKMVPDVAEEFEIGPDERSLDLEYHRFLLNERDEHALQQALLIRERQGGTVSVLALNAPEVDAFLYLAAARGADRVIKLTDFQHSLSTRAAAHLYARVIPDLAGGEAFDLILTGCQAIDDLDGLLAPLMARRLNLPYLGVVSGLTVERSRRTALATKEIEGGVKARYCITLPAVVGVMSAEKSPAYVTLGNVRAAMRTVDIDVLSTPFSAAPPFLETLKVNRPNPTTKTEMLRGTPAEIAARVCDVLVDNEVL